MRFAIRPPRTLAQVDLFGEVSDWRNPIALVRDGDVFTTTVDLPPGVYQYKLRGRGEDGAELWFLDPENPRTRAAGGRRNSVLAIEAAPEPWLFATCAPWVEELARGGLRVLCGVRDGRAVTVAWSEGATWSEATVTHAFDEDEHAFFEATLPTSAPRVQIRLTTGPHEWVKTFTRTPARERLPSWWPRAILYGIFVDRFRPAIDTPEWEMAHLDLERGAAAGGHLDGIRRSLDEIAALGVDTLYLTPVHVGASAHRYDIVDPLRIDRVLGGEDAYLALVRDARLRGMRIIQDVSFAHAGRGFPPYADVLVRGRASRYADWFLWREDGEDLVYYGKRTDAPLLNQHHPEVQALALAAVEAIARRGVKGLRLDMTAEVPIALGQKIRKRFRELVPDGIILGEVVPEHAWRWRSAGVVDAATDFGFHEILGKLVGVTPGVPPLAAHEAIAELTLRSRVRGGDPGVHAVRFVSTHDHPRLASLATRAGNAARLPLAYVLLATLPGIPMLLYGEEIGLRAASAEVRDPEDVWPDRRPMPWASALRDPAFREQIRALFAARRQSAALRHGALSILHADATTLVYRRALDAEIVDVIVSFDPEPQTIELEDDEYPALTTLATIGGASTRGPVVLLPPYSAILARRERAYGRAVPPLVARRNLALRDQDLVAARPEATARPSRFFFSVTEKCNLRCAHCITHAPERTKDGTARTMTPAVLDALAEDLGYGDYFAFVHGGESLTTPIFFDVLAAIQNARGSEPYDAHLLTNGVLFDPRSAARLVKGGVTSVSVSLDGATAATNDAIRLGERFHDIRENVKNVLAWRIREGVDLRIGISTVVLQQNLGELDAIIDLAADLGADWVKLEEGVPATPFAKRSLVVYSAADVRVAIHRAMHRGRSRGLVMVDHTRDLTVWRCRLEAATRDFLEGDEYANRSVIHPCRTPWETACIEPDGEVHCRDFYGPTLGNVTQASLRELWNAPAAQALRIASARARLCGAGPVVCL